MVRICPQRLFTLTQLLTSSLQTSREQILHASLKSKHPGIGDSETTRKEFVDTIRRDTYASLVSHDSLLTHLGVATGKCKQIAKRDILNKMAK
jgi:splicing factor 3B subunit 5